MKRVTIDQEVCIGCEACVELCPNIFGFDKNKDIAYVITPEGGDQACIEEAVASCPASCIANEEI